MQTNLSNNYNYKISRNSVQQKSDCSVRTDGCDGSSSRCSRLLCECEEKRRILSSRLLDPIRKQNKVGIQTRILLDISSEVAPQLSADGAVCTTYCTSPECYTYRILGTDRRDMHGKGMFYVIFSSQIGCA
jgi:hypothetical protein